VRYMLDTNILIYLIKNRPPSVARHIDALGPDELLCMSFFTYAELLKGAERSTRKPQLLRRLDALTRPVKVVYHCDQDLCAHYAAHGTRLKEAGIPIGASDLWIACHALAEGAVLVTNNIRQFERVKGLRLENWVD